jgi:hypothetical protein
VGVHNIAARCIHDVSRARRLQQPHQRYAYMGPQGVQDSDGLPLVATGDGRGIIMDWKPIAELTDKELGNGMWVALVSEFYTGTPVIRYLRDITELVGFPDDDMKDWDGSAVGYYLPIPDPPEE